MRSVQKIETAIGALSPREQEELFAKMDERHARAVDAQLERDLDAGAMDQRMRHAMADRESGNTRTL